MKKFLFALVALSMVAFCSCGKDDEETTDVNNQKQQSTNEISNSAYVIESNTMFGVIGKGYGRGTVTFSTIVISFTDASNGQFQWSYGDNNDGNIITSPDVLIQDFTYTYDDSTNTGSFNVTIDNIEVPFTFSYVNDSLVLNSNRYMHFLDAARQTVNSIAASRGDVQNASQARNVFKDSYWEVDYALKSEMFEDVSEFIVKAKMGIKFDANGTDAEIIFGYDTIVSDVSINATYTTESYNYINLTHGTITWGSSTNPLGNMVKNLLTDLKYIAINDTLAVISAKPGTGLSTLAPALQGLNQVFIAIHKTTEPTNSGNEEQGGQNVVLTGRSFTDGSNTINFTDASNGNFAIAITYSQMNLVISGNMTYTVSGNTVTMTVDQSSLACSNPAFTQMVQTMASNLGFSTISATVNSSNQLTFGVLTENYILDESAQ